MVWKTDVYMVNEIDFVLVLQGREMIHYVHYYLIHGMINMLVLFVWWQLKMVYYVKVS
jgi:hypothetical protein